MTKKKTAIFGATTNENRYAFLAAERLTKSGHDIVPLGIRQGEVFGERILDIRQKPDLSDVDTVTLYLGPQNQTEYYDYLLQIKPNRVIFNPGTENQELISLLKQNNIEPVEACTLVMLTTNSY